MVWKILTLLFLITSLLLITGCSPEVSQKFEQDITPDEPTFDNFELKRSIEQSDLFNEFHRIRPSITKATLKENHLVIEYDSKESGFEDGFKEEFLIVSKATIDYLENIQLTPRITLKATSSFTNMYDDPVVKQWIFNATYEEAKKFSDLEMSVEEYTSLTNYTLTINGEISESR